MGAVASDALPVIRERMSDGNPGLHDAAAPAFRQVAGSR